MDAGTVINVLCNLCRKRSSGKGDFAVSANVAYGEVNLHTKPAGETMYEDLDKMARARQDNSNYELIEHPLPSDIQAQGSHQTTSMYAAADEISNADSKQQRHSGAETNDEEACEP